MKIIRAIHYEIDNPVHDELFINLKVAKQHVALWHVTDWGMVAFREVEVTEK